MAGRQPYRMQHAQRSGAGTCACTQVRKTMRQELLQLPITSKSGRQHGTIAVLLEFRGPGPGSSQIGQVCSGGEQWSRGGRGGSGQGVAVGAVVALAV